MNIIAIDIGASFLKAGLFEDGKLIRKVHLNSPRIESEWREPVQIDKLMSMVKSAILNLSEGKREIVLSISNEMHGFILTDENGKPLTDYISWQREFGNCILKDGYTPIDYFKSCEKQIMATGMPIRSGLPSVNLRYVLEAIGKDSGFFFTLGDYILFALSGKRPVCHPTNAAATGLYSLPEEKWSNELIEAAGGTDISFPQVGIDALEFEMQGIHITALPAVGDQQATLYGADFKNKTDISFNLGTGAQVSRLIDDIELSAKWQIRPYFDGKYLKTIPHLPSGRAINVYFNFIKEIINRFGNDISDDEIWEYIIDEVSKSSKNTIKCDMSFFDNPCTDHKKGSITEIGEHDLTVGNLFNSIFAQMTNNFLWAADLISEGVQCTSRIVFSGGIATRIFQIRENIISHYPSAEVVIGSDESLKGLYKYAERME